MNKNNLQQLLALKERYDVGNMEIADLAGYSYSHINNMTSPASGLRVTSRALKLIASALAVKYPRK